jgi:hypothetical protein
MQIPGSIKDSLMEDLLDEVFEVSQHTRENPFSSDTINYDLFEYTKTCRFNAYCDTDKVRDFKESMDDYDKDDLISLKLLAKEENKRLGLYQRREYKDVYE